MHVFYCCWYKLVWFYLGEIKKTKTVVRTLTAGSDSESVNSEQDSPSIGNRRSPRVNSKIKRSADDSIDDLNNSNEENLSKNKKFDGKLTPVKQKDSKWKNSPTIKASAAGSYLRKNKLKD